MYRNGGTIYFKSLFWSIVWFIVFFLLCGAIIHNSDQKKHNDHITEITNLHVQRVEACLRFHAIYNRSQCEDYLLTTGQDEEYYQEVLKR